MSQQLVPPPCTGGQEDWHCESDVQLPHEPLLLPPLLLPDELPVPELLPLPEELLEPPELLLDTPLLEPLPPLLLLTPLPLPEPPPLLLLADTSLPASSKLLKSGGFESPDPHAAAVIANERPSALNVASFMNALPNPKMATTATGERRFAPRSASRPEAFIAETRLRR